MKTKFGLSSPVAWMMFKNGVHCEITMDKVIADSWPHTLKGIEVWSLYASTKQTNTKMQLMEEALQQVEFWDDSPDSTKGWPKIMEQLRYALSYPNP